MTGLILSVLFITLFGVVYSLTVKIIVEPRTLEHKSTVMECKYDLHGFTFDSVNWAKDDNNFFQFSRRRVPPKEVFSVPGVNLDAERSNASHVYLDMLTTESSGQYSCTVTASKGALQLATDRANMTTAERHPTPILTATRRGLFAVDTKDFSAATKGNDNNPVLSVGYHLRRNKLYTGANGGNILNHDYYYDREQPFGGILILSEESLVTSIAVDWLHNTLYFTDDYLDNVGMINLGNENRITLLESSDGVKNPESIVVDPFQGYLFWGDNDENNKKIVASALDGKTDRQTIVDTDLKRAILALDLERRRVFFIGNEGLSSCKYDGSKRKFHFQHPKLDNNVNSLSYFDNYIFWSRYDTGKSSSGLFFGPFTESSPPVKELPIKFILDVKVVHPDLQKPSLNYSCDLIECSHSCAVNASGSAYCECPDGLVLTAEGTTCIKGPTKDCEKSVTTVNSMSVCKGDLVFEDNFDKDSIDASKWQHTVRVSSDHEMEFVVFDKDVENTYMKDGNLVVKPTLLPDKTVTEGVMAVIGCTTPAVHLCQKQAFSYNIIPPVKSALLNTGHAFNFRYGIITIRAKVPEGDWLYPVLNLQATKDFYNPDYRSGLIRLASVKGNKELSCEGKESGNKALTTGVMLGPLTNVSSHFVNKTAEQKWSENFHTFKYTWTPDELSLSIDGQEKINIIPKGKTLLEVFGYSKSDIPDEWKQGTRSSPLDQNFYLSIGVSAGGNFEFPDSCGINISDESCGLEKPWKNFEVKSLLKFWQKKNCWFPTWNDRTMLLVDYVNVRAL